jgi:hypothetical protein
MMYHKNEIEKVRYLAGYVKGVAKATSDAEMAEAAKYLEELSCYICGQGYVRCDGGPECDSDHK